MSMYGKKTLQNCKVISLKLIKINGGKIKIRDSQHLMNKNFQKQERKWRG